MAYKKTTGDFPPALDTGEPPKNPWGTIDPTEIDAAVAKAEINKGLEEPAPDAAKPVDDDQLTKFLASVIKAGGAQPKPVQFVFDLSLEAERKYLFSREQQAVEVVVHNPARMALAPSGEHYIVCKDNTSVIVAPGWLCINITSVDKTKSSFGF